MLKDIGDGSFGSVVLARVRTAGATVARRGTVVRSPAMDASNGVNRFLGCHQDNEKDVRIYGTLPRVTRGHLFEVTASSCSFGTSSRHLPRSLQPKAPHLHGIYGWKFIPTDEGP